jgi:hypothetical protein
MEAQTSPVPVPAEMDFYTALQEIGLGKKATKKEWANPDIYGILKDGRLMLHKEDDKFYQWIISDGDMSGTDYVIV